MTTQHPGIEIRQLLQDDGYSEDDMYDMLAVAPSYGARMLSGQAPLTEEACRALEAYEYGPWCYWMNKMIRFNKEAM